MAYEAKMARAKSVISNYKRCEICGSRQGVEVHHVFAGPKREMSDRNGFWVYLCHDCHMSVQSDITRMRAFQVECENIYLREHQIGDWMRLVGRNYVLDMEDDPDRPPVLENELGEDVRQAGPQRGRAKDAAERPLRGAR